MLVGFLITIDVLVCFLLILVVLMQSGKGGVSNAFGIGGASQTIFGAGQAGNVLTRATWVLGGSFLLLSFLIAYLGGPSGGRTNKPLLQPTARPTGAQSSSPESSLPQSGLPQSTLPQSIPAQAASPAVPGSTVPAAPAGGGVPSTGAPAGGTTQTPPQGGQ